MCLIKSLANFWNKFKATKGLSIISVRNYHGGEFQNENICELFENFGIKHSFSTSRTSRQNGVVERKIWALQEMTRIMLNAKSTPKHFWQKHWIQLAICKKKNCIRPLLK